ncbi:helix-turn-helix domain-containing protein [Fluviicola sp.]|jgi:DNA-binding transcriptional ArsR family regulator|uniref:ArsR/SmtB family transcription factor n=1 Tax=Fluviicola sp. TaxID=1917219 RepID=UPI00281D1868|nr:helix-turn-helix domain-containing protein [Fluviicola sp.]MDR0802208.1 helix-turn-helix domain-containing protein [Fluviicola sp.]
MGSTKKEQYQPYQLRYAQLSDAMGHPARIAILEHLNSHFRANSLELIYVTKLSKSTVSQHLKELLDSKLLFERFDDYSNIHYYYLNPRAGSMMEEVVDQIFRRS